MNDTSIGESSELAAINEMLSSIGEPPVSTLDGSGNVDVANARRILYVTNKEIQSKGWTFNIEEGVTLQPDVFSGLIPYNADYLAMYKTGTSNPYINKAGFVYDRLQRTDVFEEGISVDLIRLRPLEEMPECFRRWIVARASRKFAFRFFGSPDVDQMLKEEEGLAQMDCNVYELDYGKYNALTGDAFITNQLNRG